MEYVFSMIIMLISIIVISFACYAQFTVIHEAAHSNISKNKTMNDIIGLISSVWLGPFGTWYGFKYHHLNHHMYTNNIENDPDMWCSEKGFGGKKFILLRWATLDFHYVYSYIIDKKISLNYSRLVAFEMIIKSILTFWIIYMFNFNNILIFWILPSRLAITLLAFAFDYLPHYPHDVNKNENKYLTTSYISFPWFIKLFLSPIAFYQDYHIIHHLNTQIPFYKYSMAWESNKKTLLEKIRVTRVYPELFGEEDFDFNLNLFELLEMFLSHQTE